MNSAVALSCPDMNNSIQTNTVLLNQSRNGLSGTVIRNGIVFGFKQTNRPVNLSCLCGRTHSFIVNYSVTELSVFWLRLKFFIIRNIKDDNVISCTVDTWWDPAGCSMLSKANSSIWNYICHSHVVYTCCSSSGQDFMHCVYKCVYDSLLNLMLLSTVGKVNQNLLYENVILTAWLFGVISGVYRECRLTCHCVWRCVTVLEYILVWCESVCGCINVCRDPPASLQAELANGRRIRAAESSCTLQDASRYCSSRDLSCSASPDWQAPWAAAEPCSCMHVRCSCSLQSHKGITAVSEREGWGTESRVIIGDGVGERCVWWLNNKCGISGFVWSQEWCTFLRWSWGKKGGCRDFAHRSHTRINPDIEVEVLFDINQITCFEPKYEENIPKETETVDFLSS